MPKRSHLLCAILVCAVAWPATANDWPQWRGPDRTDVSKETGLLHSWPKEGPKLLWTNADVGLGYSGPAIVGNRLYTMGAREDKEYVIAIDVSNGKEIWAEPFAGLFKNGWGDGPRGTPTVDGELLYAIGGQGELVCLDTAAGKKNWAVNLKSDLGGGVMGIWGFTESPLVDGDKVVCSPGGSKGTLAALDKRTGKVMWRSTDLTDTASYSSMVISEACGVRQYVQETAKGVAGVSAADGRLLWRHENTAFRTAVIPSPIVKDNFVYTSAGYGAGCNLEKLSLDGSNITPQSVYNNRNMANHHGGVVLVGEHLYGYSDGRGWVCQDFMTGTNLWEEKRALGKGCLTFADGYLYCYSEDKGILVLVEATPKKWTETGRFALPKQTTRRSPMGKIWTHPVVANGKLYLRDQELLYCYEIKASS